jgi:MFS family permease
MRTALAAARAPLGAFAAMGVCWGTFAASIPDLKARLAVDEAQLGLLMLGGPVAAVLAMLAAPAIGAALGRVALPVSAGLMALALVLPGQAGGSLWLFPLALACCGAATGLTDVLMNARVAEIETRRGLHLMNLCHAVYSFGYAAGSIATGVWRSAGQAPEVYMAALALPALALALASAERDGTISGLRRPGEGPGMNLGLLPLIGGGIVLIAFLTENAAENWSALHIEQTLGGSPAEGALGPAALAVTMGLSRLAGQGLAARVDPVRFLLAGAAVAAAGALVVAAAPGPAAAYAGFVIMGVGAAVLAPTALSLVGRTAPPAARARAVARATLLGYFGYFIGPPTLGLIAGLFGLRMSFVFAAGMLAAVVLLSRLFSRRAAAG